MAVPKFYCSEKKSYLILEGLTNFGLELVDWLITRGARLFVLASVQINGSGYQKLRLKLWENYGVKVIIQEKIDLSKREIIEFLFKQARSLGPVDGVFDLRRTIIPYNIESTNLTTHLVDEESRHLGYQLQSFVICSINNKNSPRMNHINYDLQSSKLNQVLKQRKNDGLHGVLINFNYDDAYEKSHESEDISLPPIIKYIENLDKVLDGEESFAEISFINSLTNEVLMNLFFLSQKVKFCS